MIAQYPVTDRNSRQSAASTTVKVSACFFNTTRTQSCIPQAKSPRFLPYENVPHLCSVGRML